MQSEVLRHEMKPWRESAVEPLPEQRCSKRQASAPQEGEKSATKPGAIHVEEKLVFPVLLEVNTGSSSEFFGLDATIISTTASYFFSDVDRGFQPETGGWRCAVHYVISEGSLARRKENRDMVRVVVGEVEKALPCHASPITAFAQSLRRCTPPEESGRLLGVWRIWMILGWIIFDLVNIVPGTWVKNITESGHFALTEHGKEGLGDLKGGGREKEAMQRC